MAATKEVFNPATRTTRPAGGKKLMIKCDDFNPTKLSFTELDTTNEKTKALNQFMVYSRYNYGKDDSPVTNGLVIKTDPIKFTQYGIPKSSVYAKEDKDRSYIKLPWDPTQDSCNKIFKMFEKIDKYMIDNKEKLFSGPLKKFIKIFEYTPIVRTPQEPITLDDDEENNDKKKDEVKPKTERFQYAKIKLNTIYETGAISTYIFSRDEAGVPVEKKVGCVDDLLNEMPWMSTAQFAISLSKAWFSKSADKSGKRNYGVTFKCQQIDVIERPAKGASSSLKTDFKNYAFDDSDDEEIKPIESKSAPAPTPAPAPVVEKSTKKTAPVTEDSSSDEEDEDESESESSSSSESEEDTKKKKQPVAIRKRK